MTCDPLTKQELYILTDALIHYNYGYVTKPHSLSTKYKIKIIQKKLLKMEDNALDDS